MVVVAACHCCIIINFDGLVQLRMQKYITNRKEGVHLHPPTFIFIIFFYMKLTDIIKMNGTVSPMPRTNIKDFKSKMAKETHQQTNREAQTAKQGE